MTKTEMMMMMYWNDAKSTPYSFSRCCWQIIVILFIASKNAFSSGFGSLSLAQRHIGMLLPTNFFVSWFFFSFTPKLKRSGVSIIKLPFFPFGYLTSDGMRLYLQRLPLTRALEGIFLSVETWVFVDVNQLFPWFSHALWQRRFPHHRWMNLQK